MMGMLDLCGQYVFGAHEAKVTHHSKHHKMDKVARSVAVERLGVYRPRICARNLRLARLL